MSGMGLGEGRVGERQREGEDHNRKGEGRGAGQVVARGHRFWGKRGELVETGRGVS